MNLKSQVGRDWLAVFLWALVIFALSSIKQIAVSDFFVWDFIAKKIAHVGEYSILFALLFRATKNNYRTAFIATLVYAVTDEIHQSFVPGRTAAIYDLGFDLTGANIAAYIIWKHKPRLTWLKAPRRHKPTK